VADTVLNKLFKNAVRQRFYDWSASLVAEQVKSSIALKDCKLDLSVGRLRDEGIHWIYAGWERIKGMQRSVLEATPRRAPSRSLRRGRGTGPQPRARNWACRQNCRERQQQS
jgi:hypothetical protein